MPLNRPLTQTEEKLISDIREHGAAHVLEWIDSYASAVASELIRSRYADTPKEVLPEVLAKDLIATTMSMSQSTGTGMNLMRRAEISAISCHLSRTGFQNRLSQKIDAEFAAIMDSQTYVAYSAQVATNIRGAGFWSNEHGWGDLQGATTFTKEEIEAFNLPQVGANDAKWINMAEAKTLLDQESQQPKSPSTRPKR